MQLPSPIDPIETQLDTGAGDPGARDTGAGDAGAPAGKASDTKASDVKGPEGTSEQRAERGRGAALTPESGQRAAPLRMVATRFDVILVALTALVATVL